MPGQPTKIAAVFSVGQTPGGCEFALNWLLRETTDRPELFFFYGHGEAGQTPSPLKAVGTLLDHVAFQGLKRGGEQATNAFSLDRAYVDALEFVRRIEARGFERVYVGITGGTNPMVAALFHAAMSELTCEVIPLYVQAVPTADGKQESIELIPGLRTREAISMERILGLARRGQLTAAAELAVSLPERGRPGFLKNAILALARWDNFEYEAGPDLRKLADRCDDFADDRLLAPLVGTIRRYGEVVHHISDLVTVFSKPALFFSAAARPGWSHQVKNRGFWGPLDALANGWRRVQEGRATDAVLRAYRAVEIAAHARLFALNVHPSALDWERPPLEAIAHGWQSSQGRLPREVALEQAIALVTALTGVAFQRTMASRLKIEECRNHTFLEHGYRRVDREAGAAILTLAEEVVGEILWAPCIEERQLLQMNF
jgi:hypothetical protein